MYKTSIFEEPGLESRSSFQVFLVILSIKHLPGKRILQTIGKLLVDIFVWLDFHCVVFSLLRLPKSQLDHS